MGGEEAILAAAIAIDSIHEHSDLEVVSGTPARNKRFDYHIVNSSCEQDAQSRTGKYADYAAEVVVVLHHHIEQRDIQGNLVEKKKNQQVK